MAQAEFIQVQKALGGLSYPATRDQLIEHARGKNASRDILDALESIPDREYDGPSEVSKAVPGRERGSTMPSAFDVLGRDHEEVKRMLTELELGPTAAGGAGSDQLALRKKMVQHLVIEESRHEAVEEMYFWPAVRSHLTDGTDLANQAQQQEQEGKEVLDRLDKLEAGDKEFEGLLAEFITAGRAHIAFEETTVWPSLRANLSAAEADELGRKLAEGKKTAPTRPHPKTPASPGVLKTAGPAVAAADRLRDAATGRDE